MNVVIHSYTTAQRRAAAERIRALVLDGEFEVDYSDCGLGRTYAPNCGVSDKTVGVLAVCFGRLGMQSQVTRDAECDLVELHVAWDQAAWDAAWK
jgi:hypothetical protein